jgi:hypothetical protein
VNFNLKVTESIVVTDRVALKVTVTEFGKHQINSIVFDRDFAFETHFRKISELIRAC